MKNRSVRAVESSVSVVRSDSVVLCLDADGKLPQRIRVLNWGENPNANGKRVFVGDRLVACMQSSVYPWHQVALDFQYNTVPDHPAYKESSEPRRVAGFGKVEVVPGDGVFLRMQRWTPDGLSCAHNYSDVSAAPVCNDSGEVIGIHSVALCRNGAVPGMDFVQVALSISSDVLAAIGGESVNTNNEETQMKKLMAIIAGWLGMDPETATEEELVAGVQAKLAAKEEKPDTPDPEALSALVANQVKAAVEPLTARIEALSTSNDAFAAALLKRDKAALVDAGARAGKVVSLSADLLDKMTLEEVSSHVEALAVTVPLDKVTPDNLTNDTAKGKRVLTDSERLIALNCGIDPESIVAG